MANGRGANRPHLHLLPTVLLTLAILALPTAVYAWGRSSPSFSIERVVVTGADLVPERRLKRQLRDDYLGRNLFTVTNEDVRGTLKSLSYVATATVDRDFPSTLRVHIEEHRPIAYVRSSSRWFVVADDAYVITALTPAATPSPSTTPSPSASATRAQEQGIDGAEDFDELQAGPPDASLRLPRFAAGAGVRAGRTLDDPAARVAVTAIASLTKPLRDRLEVVEVDSGQATLRFGAGLRAMWGDGERPLAKTMALRAVLKRYRDRDVRCTYVDVSTPERVLAHPMLQ